jgi:hypothetical protein
LIIKLLPEKLKKLNKELICPKNYASLLLVKEGDELVEKKEKVVKKIEKKEESN